MEGGGKGAHGSWERGGLERGGGWRWEWGGGTKPIATPHKPQSLAQEPHSTAQSPQPEIHRAQPHSPTTTHPQTPTALELHSTTAPESTPPQHTALKPYRPTPPPILPHSTPVQQIRGPAAPGTRELQALRSGVLLWGRMYDTNEFQSLLKAGLKKTLALWPYSQKRSKLVFSSCLS